MTDLFRPATLGDLIELRQLFAEFLDERLHLQPYPVLGEDTLATFTQLLAARMDDPTFVCWVAQEHAGGAIASFMVGEICTRPIGHPARFFFIHYIYVVPEARGRRLGWQLFLASGPLLQRHGCGAVEGGAVPGDNQWARRGWMHVGSTYALPIAEALDPTRHAEEAHGADEPEVSSA